MNPLKIKYLKKEQSIFGSFHSLFLKEMSGQINLKNRHLEVVIHTTGITYYKRKTKSKLHFGST